MCYYIWKRENHQVEGNTAKDGCNTCICMNYIILILASVLCIARNGYIHSTYIPSIPISYAWDVGSWLRPEGTPRIRVVKIDIISK